MLRAAVIGKALADPARVRLVASCLHAAEMKLAADICACQLIDLVGLAPSTVSRHLAILRDAGLLASRRDGRWIYYRTVDERDAPSPEVIQALSLIRVSLATDDALRDDVRALNTILDRDPEEVCRTQRPSTTRVATRDSSCCSSVPEIHVEARWRKGSPRRSSTT